MTLVGDRFTHGAHYRKIPFASLCHSVFNRIFIQAHDNLIGVVFGFAEEDVKRVATVFCPEYPDTGNRLFLDIIKFRVD